MLRDLGFLERDAAEEEAASASLQQANNESAAQADPWQQVGATATPSTLQHDLAPGRMQSSVTEQWHERGLSAIPGTEAGAGVAHGHAQSDQAESGSMVPMLPDYAAPSHAAPELQHEQRLRGPALSSHSQAGWPGHPPNGLADPALQPAAATAREDPAAAYSRPEPAPGPCDAAAVQFPSQTASAEMSASDVDTDRMDAAAFLSMLADADGGMAERQPLVPFQHRHSSAGAGGPGDSQPQHTRTGADAAGWATPTEALLTAQLQQAHGSAHSAEQAQPGAQDLLHTHHSTSTEGKTGSASPSQQGPDSADAHPLACAGDHPAEPLCDAQRQHRQDSKEWAQVLQTSAAACSLQQQDPTSANAHGYADHHNADPSMQALPGAHHRQDAVAQEATNQGGASAMTSQGSSIALDQTQFARPTKQQHQQHQHAQGSSSSAENVMLPPLPSQKSALPALVTDSHDTRLVRASDGHMARHPPAESSTGGAAGGPEVGQHAVLVQSGGMADGASAITAAPLPSPAGLLSVPPNAAFNALDALPQDAQAGGAVSARLPKEAVPQATVPTPVKARGWVKKQGLPSNRPPPVASPHPDSSGSSSNPTSTSEGWHANPCQPDSPSSQLFPDLDPTAWHATPLEALAVTPQPSSGPVTGHAGWPLAPPQLAPTPSPSQHSPDLLTDPKAWHTSPSTAAASSAARSVTDAWIVDTPMGVGQPAGGALAPNSPAAKAHAGANPPAGAVLSSPVEASALAGNGGHTAQSAVAQIGTSPQLAAVSSAGTTAIVASSGNAARSAMVASSGMVAPSGKVAPAVETPSKVTGKKALLSQVIHLCRCVLIMTCGLPLQRRTTHGPVTQQPCLIPGPTQSCLGSNDKRLKHRSSSSSKKHMRLYTG